MSSTKPEAARISKSDQKRFQILCLSGGGFMGLYSASVLSHLEKGLGVPIGRCFDLIAGTSVGGIIALGLAADQTAASIEDAFLSHGSQIFGAEPPITSRRKLLARLARHATRPYYNSEPLRATIREIVAPETKIGDLNTRVMIPAVNLTKGKPQVFKTPHHPTFVRDLHLSVEDVALATSAAPSFFPTHRIGAEVFADGGLYANSPDQLALHEALHFLGQDLADIHLLSIGTTSTSISWSNATKQEMGWFDWIKDQKLISAMMAAQQINADYVLRHQLADRYLRIDAVPSHEQAQQLALDIASPTAIQDLRALAEASARAVIPGNELRAILSHRAPPAVFNNQARTH